MSNGAKVNALCFFMPVLLYVVAGPDAPAAQTDLCMVLQ